MTTEVAPAEITLTGYEDVRVALGNADLVRSVDAERFERGNLMERVLLMISGSEHRERRRAENLLFRRETIERFEREVLPPVIEATMARAAALGRGDLLDIGGQIAVVMAATIAGVDADLEDEAERERLSEYLHSFARGEALDAATGDIETIKRAVMEDLAEFDERYLGPARARREALIAELEAVSPGSTDEAPTDVLAALLRGRTDLGIDDPLMVREAAFFFEAGAHTSSQTFTNALHQIMAWLAEDPRRRQSRLHDDLAWVQRAVHEALRMRPTNPLMRRRAERDTEVRGRSIREGTLLFLDTAAANRDPAFGPDADRFDPDRVLPRELAPFGTSFGGGIHLCIGRTLAVGLPQRPGEPLREGHLVGVVPIMVREALRRGVEPDPDAPPTPDEGTRRWTRWQRYPVRFTR